jgi:DNA-binding response OmpR family regulator
MSDSTQKHILIVEDDSDYHTRLNDFLSAHDFNVSVADTGDMAMEKLLFHKANLVLLDLLLPKVDGFEIIKRIREYPDPEVAQTPIIVVSNLSSEADIAHANQYGISGYLVKSTTNNQEILAKVNEVLFKGEPNPSYEVLDFRNLISE